ncbi:MAG: single-stranded DNA-binding protein [Muribaculaceae bacterium]|nr:single-stranded DNA-binding protein [Muribaculaceae bacterium]
MSVNKVILIGNVGRDPEIRYPEKDFPVAYLSLATNERQPNSDNELVEWHILVMTGKNATLAERYIRKGTKLYVEGKLRSREYVDKLKISRRRTEIYVDVVELLGRN